MIGIKTFTKQLLKLLGSQCFTEGHLSRARGQLYYPAALHEHTHTHTHTHTSWSSNDGNSQYSGFLAASHFLLNWPHLRSSQHIHKHTHTHTDIHKHTHTHLIWPHNLLTVCTLSRLLVIQSQRKWKELNEFKRKIRPTVPLNVWQM